MYLSRKNEYYYTRMMPVSYRNVILRLNPSSVNTVKMTVNDRLCHPDDVLFINNNVVLLVFKNNQNPENMCSLVYYQLLIIRLGLIQIYFNLLNANETKHSLF